MTHICRPIAMYWPRDRWPYWSFSCIQYCLIANSDANIYLYKKLSCRRETARRFVSLNILLSYSRSLVTQGHSKWHCWVGRMWVPIGISLKLCLYVVPFLRYSASKNGVNLKLGVGVVQVTENGVVRTTFNWSAIVSIAVCCTIFKLFDIE